MTSTQSIEFTLNTAAPELQVIRLADSRAADFPFFSAVIQYHQRFNKGHDFKRYQFNTDVQLSYFWQPLLQNNQTATIFEFPPNLIESYINTLELQAARMLSNAAQHTQCHIKVLVPKRDTPSLLEKILQATQDNSRPLLAIGKQLQAHFTIRKTDKPVEQLVSSLNEQTRPKETGYFLNALMANDRRQLIDQIDQSADNPLLTSQYINALSSNNDVILEDRAFKQFDGSEKEKLYAQLLHAFASITCSVPFPIKELDRLIEQCEVHDLPYWQAFLLSSGHIVRAFDEKFSIGEESIRFIKAHRLYKQLSDFVGITRVFHSRASLLSKHNKHRSAIRLLTMCQHIRSFLQEPFGVAKVFNGMAFSYLQIDELDAALESHQQAERYLVECKQYDELAFTYSQISWVLLLKGQYDQAVYFGQKTLSVMQANNISTLPFRTRPDLYAMLGLAHFFAGHFDLALEQSNYCEAHRVDSSATGEIIRTMLRGLINDHRQETHLAGISFNSIPQLIAENTEIDVHIELLYLKLMLNRLSPETDQWKIDHLRRQAISMCRAHQLKTTLQWFEQ